MIEIDRILERNFWNCKGYISFRTGLLVVLLGIILIGSGSEKEGALAIVLGGVMILCGCLAMNKNYNKMQYLRRSGKIVYANIYQNEFLFHTFFYIKAFYNCRIQKKQYFLHILINHLRLVCIGPYLQD